MEILFITIASICSSALYRLGGSQKNGDWWDWMKHSKTRDWGCTIIALVALALMGKTLIWYWYILTFIACWAALTTYYDDLFGYDNYIAHLAVIGVTFLMFPIVFGCWVGYVLRIIVMGGFGLLSHRIDKTSIPHRDVVSELVRGFSIVITLLLIG